MIALIGQEIKLALRSGGAWLHGVLFFILFCLLCAVALGGDAQTLTPLAPALLWLAVILSLLLSYDRLFQDDASDGTLAQLSLSGTPLWVICAAKFIAAWALHVLPLLVMIPLAGYAFALPGISIAALFNAVLIGSPALLLYGGFASACLLGYRNAGLLVLLLTVPFILPTLIFGLSAVDSFSVGGTLSAPYKALAGISLLSIGLGLPATAAALKTYLETT